MLITVKQKQAFGRVMYEPICDKSELFAKMLKCLCISSKQMINIKRLGFEVRIMGANDEELRNG